MRRSLVPTLAVLTVIAQLALGVSAHLGLVLCVGSDHAAIESAADDCCASHGTVGSRPVATLERDCCSDTPLYSAVRPLSDVPRPYAASISLVAALPSAAVAVLLPAGEPVWDLASPPPSSPAVRRSVVLRV